MIKETATVIAIDGDRITVEAAIKSTCSSCQAQSSCGTGAISRALAPKTQQLTLRSPLPVSIGQRVTVGVPEAGVLSASAWLYLIPLLVFITTMLGLSQLLPMWGMKHELWPLIPAVLITFATYRFVAKRLKHRDHVKYQTVLLSGISE
jgi:sigma-E factor negative regulatory protein RseC